MAGWEDILGALGSGASGLWGAAASNPTDALSLGVGAAGTGLGVWDIVNANQQARNRDFMARQWARGIPQPRPQGSYMPALTDEVRAQMVRPTAANLGTAGIDPTSGAWRSAIADSLSGQYANLYNQSEANRMQDYQAALQAYMGQQQGWPNPRQSMGSVAGLPQALQWMQVARALRQPQAQPGAAETTNLPNMDIYSPGSPLGSDLKTNWPQGDVSGGKFGGQYGNIYPDYATSQY